MDFGDRHRSTRTGYDAAAEAYAARYDNELDHKPLDRALLRALFEQTPAGGPIVDVGCGPGHVAAWLAGLGAPAVGIDLSPGMIAMGRRLHPEVEFRPGDFLELPAADGEFAGAVALYSIIHLAPDELAPALLELRRVLQSGGRLLLSFHVGSEVRRVTDLLGQAVEIDFRFLEPTLVASSLDDSGFEMEAQVLRRNYAEEVETNRAYLLARRRG